MTKQLSVQEYAIKYGHLIEKSRGVGYSDPTVTRQAIAYRIKHNIPLPLATEIKKIGKAYIITVDEKKQL